MEDFAVSKLLKIINTLSLDSKLEILSKLSNSLKVDFKQNTTDENKEVLLDELFGVWKDFPDGLEGEILSARNTSNKEINFD